MDLGRKVKLALLLGARSYSGLLASLLEARTLLGARGLTTRSKDATRKVHGWIGIKRPTDRVQGRGGRCTRSATRVRVEHSCFASRSLKSCAGQSKAIGRKTTWSLAALPMVQKDFLLARSQNTTSATLHGTSCSHMTSHLQVELGQRCIQHLRGVKQRPGPSPSLTSGPERSASFN